MSIAKRILLVVTLLVATLNVMADMAVPVRKTIQLTDGTWSEATLCGDEHLHFFQLADGRLALPSVGPLCRIAEQREVNDLWTENAKAERQKQRTMQRRMMSRARQKANPFTGTKRGLVVLVNFVDETLRTTAPITSFNDLFNKEGYNQNGNTGSVHDYFYAQSYGQFDFRFDVVGPVKLSHTMSYYGSDGEKIKDLHAQDMVIESCQQLDSTVDFSQYDWDGDGEVDMIFFIYAGYAQSNGASSETIWPHKSTVYDSKLTLDGVRIGTYACSSELKGTAGTQMSGIGTPCHEFSHCFGIGDHYDTAYSGNIGTGDWDLMASGNHLGGGYTPCGYNAFERWSVGWMVIPELNSTTYIQALRPLDETPDAYVIYNDYNHDECYILENRQQQGWDCALGGHGMLVHHLDFDAYYWAYNIINATERQRFTIIAADGTPCVSLAGDPYPGTGNKQELTDTTFPKATVNTPGPDGYACMGKPITDIQEQEGIISFAFMRGALPVPVLNDPEQLSATSFTISWQPIEGATSYKVQLTEKPKPFDNPEQACIVDERFAKCYSKSTGLTNIAKSLDKYLATTGWTGTQLFTSPSLLKMGKGDKPGTLVTPVFETPLADDLTFVFTYKPFTAGTEVKSTVTITYGEQNLYGSLNTTTEDTFVLHARNITAPFQVSFEPKAAVYISRFSIFDGRFTARQLGLDAEEDEEESSAPASVRRGARTVTEYTTTDPSYTFTGLTTTSTYYVTVMANTDMGSSKWSRQMEVKLSADDDALPTILTPPSAPSSFDLSGRQIVAPTHPGIYIRGGRKVLLK